MEGETSHDEKLKIGIMGAARIARKNAQAINHLSSECVITAVASRDKHKAEKFVQEFISDMGSHHNVTIYESYEDLLLENICDAVYIPLPTKLHKKWVIQALRSGKHVLVEKPVAVSVEDFSEMVQVAKECGKFLLDGTMFVHNPRTKCFLEKIQNMEFDRIQSDFTFCGDEEFFKNDIRCRANGDPLGCIGDVGWYCIRAAILIYMAQNNNALVAATTVHTVHAITNDEGVPIDVTCLVYFGDKLLSFHCSFLHALRQELEVRGSHSTVVIHDFVIPSDVFDPKYEIHSMDLNFMDLQAIKKIGVDTVETSSSQESYMWKTFSRLSRATDKSSLWNEEASTLSDVSLHTQLIVNAAVESIRQGCAKIQV